MSYNELAEFLVEDKVGDIFYFKSLIDIGIYFNLTYPETCSVMNYCCRSGKYSPSKKIYIQRLYRNVNLATRSFKNIKFDWELRKIYPNIIVND